MNRQLKYHAFTLETVGVSALVFCCGPRLCPLPMSLSTLELVSDDWRRLRDALRYQARDLHHRSYAVPADRRELLWQEMDRCLDLAERIEGLMPPENRCEQLLSS